MRGASLCAGLALGTFAGLAHAEGNHNFEGIFSLLAYALVALLVMLGQGIYALCLPRATWAVKVPSLIALAGINVIAVQFLISALDHNTFNMENPTGFVLAVIPGFVFLYLITTRLNRPPAAKC